jgi:hypothetical protein
MLAFAPMALVLLLATYTCDADPHPVRRFSGTLTGLLALVLVGLGLGLVAGLGLATVAKATVVVALPLDGPARSGVRARVLANVAAVREAVAGAARHPTPRLVGAIAALSAVGIALWVIFDHAARPCARAGTARPSASGRRVARVGCAR